MLVALNLTVNRKDYIYGCFPGLWYAARVTHDISADRPLEDPQDDRLGYAPFAKNLAENICKMKHGEGFVLGIYAPWGSGKSSLLNFVAHYLNQKPEKERPTIVRFNPWWFTGQENLAKEFFTQLLAVLGHKGRITRIRLVTAALAERVAGLSRFDGGLASMGIGIVARWLMPKERDVFALKEQLSTLLRKRGGKILVILDDVDRLADDEIRQCFQLIKAVADFPNVVYLLAFDRDVVCDALRGVQGGSGEKYLQKIIQVPFELPTPDRMSLQSLLFGKLDQIIADTPEKLFDKTYWGNVYHKGIDHFIHTPRDVTVLANAIQATYPAVMGEVNPVDFIAIEALRIFAPFIYNTIRRNSESFTGSHGPLSMEYRTTDTLKPFHDAWLGQVPEADRKAVRTLIEQLFPKVRGVLGNSHYGPEWEEKWRKGLRVCSGDIFPTYFRLAIPEGSFSAKELETILSLASDAGAFAAKLLELSKETRTDGANRTRVLLERIEDYTDDLEEEKIAPVVRALFDIGDELQKAEGKRRGMFDFGIRSSVGRVAYQLLSRLPEERRFTILKEALEHGRALGTAIQKLTGLAQQHGRYGSEGRPEKDRLLTTEHLAELEKIVLRKIEAAAADGQLAKSDRLTLILYRWEEWGDATAMREWLRKYLETDEGLIHFVMQFLSEPMSITMGDVIAKRMVRLDPEWMRHFVDSDQIAERVKILAKRKNLSEDEQKALQQFLIEYDLRKQGKDPEDEFDRRRRA